MKFVSLAKVHQRNYYQRVNSEIFEHVSFKIGYLQNYPKVVIHENLKLWSHVL